MAIEQYPKIESVTYWQKQQQDTLDLILAAISGGGGPTTPFHVIVDSSALPTGASTSALQITGNNILSSIDSKIVHVDTGNVTIVASALPTGASTSANQLTEIASLASIDSKIVIADTDNVTVISSVLPTGAATQATLAALNAKVVTVDTGNVTISTALPAGGNTIGNIGTVGSIVGALPAGSNVIGSVNQGTSPWVITGSTTVSGTVTANQGTSPWVTSFVAPQHVILDSGTLTTITNPVTVAQAIAANLNATVVFASPQAVTQSGTWNINTLGTITNPLPAGSNTIGAVTQASGPWTVNLTQLLSAVPSVSNPFPSRLTDGSAFIGSTTYSAVAYQNVAKIQKDITSTNNSSTANLNASATFTGTSESTIGFGTIIVSFIADQACTVQVQQSEDGTNWDFADSYSVNANTGTTRPFGAQASFVRVLVQNTGGSPTTFLRLQTSLMSDPATLPRALTSSGNLKVAIAESTATQTVSTKTALTASAPAAASVGVASVTAVAANANRKGLTLVNTSVNTISLSFGGTAVLNSGITLYPGGTFCMDEYCYNVAAVTAIASAAASNLSIQEYT